MFSQRVVPENQLGQPQPAPAPVLNRRGILILCASALGISIVLVAAILLTVYLPEPDCTPRFKVNSGSISVSPLSLCTAGNESLQAKWSLELSVRNEFVLYHDLEVFIYYRNQLLWNATVRDDLVQSKKKMKVEVEAEPLLEHQVARSIAGEMKRNKGLTVSFDLKIKLFMFDGGNLPYEAVCRDLKIGFYPSSFMGSLPCFTTLIDYYVHT